MLKVRREQSGNGVKRGRRRWVMAVVAVVLVAAAALAIGSWPWRRPVSMGDLVKRGDAAGFNVLLITWDTTRRDALSCYGRKGAETPTIDALVADGVCFDDAVTSAPLTLPSHATIFTGLYPPNHGVLHNGTHHLVPEHETLAETLKAHGYETAAFVASFVLDARFGLAQGFDVYDSQVSREEFREGCIECNERKADAVTDAAIEWLGTRQSSGESTPFFAWVHYFDAHTPLRFPAREAAAFQRAGL